MCGLVGVAGAVGIPEEKAFKRLLELDTVRGPHSTGIAALTRAGTVIIAKNVGTPFDLKNDPEFKSVYQANLNVLMGHNRWATCGDINRFTAHPFEFEKLVGAHNGTLKRQNLLQDSHRFAVDSENLYYHMNENGLNDTLDKTDGAFALTWFDKEAGTINFIRNDERPLYYLFNEDKSCVFWASEQWMLNVALSHANVKMDKLIYVFAERKHYSMKITTGFKNVLSPWTIADKALHKPEPISYPSYTGYPKYLGGNQKKTLPATTSGPENSANEKNGNADTSSPNGLGSGLASLLNTSLSLSIRGHVLGGDIANPYIYGTLVGNEKVRWRMYKAPPGKGQAPDELYWQVISDQALIHKAEFKGFVNCGNTCYYTVDRRTMELLTIDESDDLIGDDEDDDSFEELYKDHEGLYVCEDQFKEDYKDTKCGWCDQPADHKDAEDYAWTSSTEFVCGGCMEDKDVASYVNP